MISITSLADHRFRYLGLSIAIIGILLYTILQFLDYEYLEGWENRIFIINHFIIVFGLFMMIFSKEINDDERVKVIRYTLLRLSFTFVVCGILMYYSLTILDRVKESYFVVLYIIEGVLVLNQILFRIFLRTNPAWVFRESSKGRYSFVVMAAALLFLVAWVIIVVVQYRL